MSGIYPHILESRISVPSNIDAPGSYNTQSVSCEIKFAHAHVRARPHMCDVRAKRLSKRVCDVRACGRFLGVRRAIAISHVLG